jgi:hypothetical protein
VNLVANCTEFDYIVNFVVNILAYSIACARCRQGFRPTELTCAPPGGGTRRTLDKTIPKAHDTSNTNHPKERSDDAMPATDKKGHSTQLTFGGKRKKVRFGLSAGPDSKVFVAGTFNDWDPQAHPLRYNPKGSVFETAFFIARGRHEYKFVVDGNWRTDPGNGQAVANAYGSLNSVIEV